MTDREGRILITWGGIIGAFVFGVMGWIIYLDKKPIIIMMTTGVGIIAGGYLVFGILWLIGKSIGNPIMRGLVGLLVGVFAGACWTIGVGGFVKWFEGWAFIVGIIACIVVGLLGLLSGLFGGWQIKRILETRGEVKGNHILMGVAVLAVLILFVVLPHFVKV